MDIVSIAIALLCLAVLIGWHELGHFIAARACGVQVLRFSIGFGKSLWSWKDKTGTEYTLSAIPFGGYVRMLGEDALSSDNEVKSEKMFSSKSTWQRLIIVLAGPFANMLLTFLLFIVINSTGTTTVKPVIGNIAQSSIAANSSVISGDIITAIDDKKVSSWSDIALSLVERIGNSGIIKITTTDDNNQKKVYNLAIENWLSQAIEPDPISALGIEPFRPIINPIIAVVQSDSSAEIAGLLPNDIILAVNNIDITTWQQLVQFIRQSPNSLLSLQVQRGDSIIGISLLPDIKTVNNKTIGFAGISPEIPEYPQHFIVHTQLNPIATVIKSFSDSYNLGRLVVVSIYKLITGDIALGNISGPIGIIKVTGQSADAGVWTFLAFIAYLSMSLGILNLLPVPVLDGGQALFLCVEGITGRAIPNRWQELAMRIGIAILIGLMIVATIHDIFKL